MPDEIEGVLVAITVLALAGTILHGWTPNGTGKLLIGLVQVGVFTAVGMSVMQAVVGW